MRNIQALTVSSIAVLFLYECSFFLIYYYFSIYYNIILLFSLFILLTLYNIHFYALSTSTITSYFNIKISILSLE